MSRAEISSQDELTAKEIEEAFALCPDPPPARVGYAERTELFRRVPDELIQRFRYYRGVETDWSTYLFPPASFAVYGSRYLKRLKFDNSLASLRLWGFMMTESERLFRARQCGRKVIACLADLGGVTPIVYAAGNAVAFYPDCFWWTPFFMESRVLFDAASELGMGEECCFSRASLGAFHKRAYFPKPDLCIAGSGASCDDFASVTQLAQSLTGQNVVWYEIPPRIEPEECSPASGLCFRRTHEGDAVYPAHVLEFLVSEYQRVLEQVQEVCGRRITDGDLASSIRRTNRLRRTVRRIRDLAYGADPCPLPALEAMNAEFAVLHGYSDPEECQRVLDQPLHTVERRVRCGEGVLPPDALRVTWVGPPADMRLLNLLEDMGARVAGTEYMINQSLSLISEEMPPLEALADCFLNASLIGSCAFRARKAVSEARRYGAEGIIVSGVVGGSHCVAEEYAVRRMAEEQLGIPTLYIDVPFPLDEPSGQVKTRMEAFVELLRMRRADERKT